MKYRWARLVCLAFSFCLLSFPTLADEIRLANGDTVTGEVLRMEDGQLTIDTDYAGEIAIAWEKIVSIRTEKMNTVVLKGGEIRQGSWFLRQTAGAVSASDSDDAAHKIDIDSVAGINIQPKPTIKITARVNAGFGTESGNTNKEQINADAELLTRKDKHRFTLGGVLNREDADDLATARNWRAYGLYDYFLSAKWFLYANAFFENDKFADLDLRTSLGAGAGYQFVESERLNLSFTAGPSYVFEDFIVAPDDEYSAAQWLIRYDQYLFDKFMQLYHDSNGIVSLENANQWLVKTRQGLRFPIYKGFVMSLQYNYDYNNRPSPDAASKDDSKLMLLVGWQFEN